MPRGWQWDETLFRGSAAYYDRGRLPYAPGYADRLAATLGLDGTGRLLDVGCGPGTVTLAVAGHVAEAVGLDPDPDMLAEARRRADLLGVAGVRWVRARAEDLPAGLGEFRVVVFAQSFHWTDRERVAATVFGMLEPGGWLVNVADLDGPVEPAPPPHPAPPFAAIGALTRGYLGEVRRAGQGVLAHGTGSGEDEVVTGAGFDGVRRLAVGGGDVVERTVDDLVAWAFSRSDMAPHLFGDRLADFERDLRDLLTAAAPGGVFAERRPATELMYWRKPSISS